MNRNHITSVKMMNIDKPLCKTLRKYSRRTTIYLFLSQVSLINYTE